MLVPLDALSPWTVVSLDKLSPWTVLALYVVSVRRLSPPLSLTMTGPVRTKRSSLVELNDAELVPYIRKSGSSTSRAN